MGEFDNRPLVRDVDDSRRIEVALPRTLQISCSDVRQVYPPVEVAGNELLISTATVRFSEEGPTDEGGEADEYAEVDEHEYRTVTVRLRAPQVSTKQFVGSASFAALANIVLHTTDPFLVAVDDAITRFTSPTEDGTILSQDIWLEADVVGGINRDDSSQINRMGYQSISAIKR